MLFCCFEYQWRGDSWTETTCYAGQSALFGFHFLRFLRFRNWPSAFIPASAMVAGLQYFAGSQTFASFASSSSRELCAADRFVAEADAATVVLYVLAFQLLLIKVMAYSTKAGFCISSHAWLS